MVSIVVSDLNSWKIFWMSLSNIVVFSRHMGGVDLSDALISYYDLLRKTRKWYKTLFYHFLDIAIVNAFILHKSLCQEKGEKPISQKVFRETLAMELAEVGRKARKVKVTTPKKEAMPEEEEVKRHHRLVHLSGDKTSGRRRCRMCGNHTPVMCSTCETPLCFVPSRDCYNEWHEDKNM